MERAPSTATPQIPAGLHVLIVDDDQAFRTSFRYLLEEVYACDVTECAYAQQAREVIRSDHAFDLIFIDIEMPDVDGYQLCHDLRATGDATPVVLMSALDLNRERVSALRVPFFDKTLGVGDLENIIGTFFRGSAWPGKS